MNNEHAEQLSIILETIAFFLVTIDLYGKERLEYLSDKINTIRSSNLKLQFKNKLKIIYRRIPLFTVAIILLNILIFYIVNNYFKEKLVSLHDSGMSIEKMRNLLFWSISTTVILLYILINYAAYFAFAILCGMISVIQILIRLIKIEGLMLFIGTMFFIASKIITFCLTLISKIQ